MSKPLLSTFMLIVLLMLAKVAAAQYYQKELSADDPKIFKKNSVSFDLKPLFFQHGYEFSYARKISNSNWLAVQPIYYSQNNYNGRNENLKYMQMRGYGVGLYGYYYTDISTVLKNSLFVKYGVSYNEFEIKDFSYATTDITKYGLDCMIGLHQIFARVFYLDVALGISTCKTEFDYAEDADIAEKYDKNSFSPGYSGNYFNFALNVGVVF